ncbi:hypothetical protein ACFVH7_08490 [Kitasatospora indigofera]
MSFSLSAIRRSAPPLKMVSATGFQEETTRVEVAEEAVSSRLPRLG